MLSRIQNPCLWGYRINCHHLVHLMFSSAFDKTVYSRTNIKVDGVDSNLQDKEIKLSCLNQFLQQKVKLLSPDVYAHVHPIIKG